MQITSSNNTVETHATSQVKKILLFYMRKGIFETFFSEFEKVGPSKPQKPWKLVLLGFGCDVYPGCHVEIKPKNKISTNISELPGRSMITKSFKLKKRKRNMGQIISKEKKQKREGLMAQMKDKTEVKDFPFVIN